MLELAISIVVTVIVLLAILYAIYIVGAVVVGIGGWLLDRNPSYSPPPRFDPTPHVHWTGGRSPAGTICECGLCSQRSWFAGWV